MATYIYRQYKKSKTSGIVVTVGLHGHEGYGHWKREVAEFGIEALDEKWDITYNSITEFYNDTGFSIPNMGGDISGKTISEWARMGTLSRTSTEYWEQYKVYAGKSFEIKNEAAASSVQLYADGLAPLEIGFLPVVTFLDTGFKLEPRNTISDNSCFSECKFSPLTGYYVIQYLDKDAYNRASNTEKKYSLQYIIWTVDKTNNRLYVYDTSTNLVWEPDGEYFPDGSFWQIKNQYIDKNNWWIRSDGTSPNCHAEVYDGWSFECRDYSSYYSTSHAYPTNNETKCGAPMIDTGENDSSQEYFWKLIQVIDDDIPQEKLPSHYPQATNLSEVSNNNTIKWGYNESYHWPLCRENDNHPDTFKGMINATYNNGMKQVSWPYELHDIDEETGKCKKCKALLSASKSAPEIPEMQEDTTPANLTLTLTFNSNEDIPNNLWLVVTTNNVINSILSQPFALDTSFENPQITFNNLPLTKNQKYNFYIRVFNEEGYKLLEDWSCDNPIITKLSINQDQVYEQTVYHKHAEIVEGKRIIYISEEDIPTITPARGLYITPVPEVDESTLLKPILNFEEQQDGSVNVIAIDESETDNDFWAIYIDDEKVWEQTEPVTDQGERILHYRKPIPVEYLNNGTKWIVNLEEINAMISQNLTPVSITWYTELYEKKPTQSTLYVSEVNNDMVRQSGVVRKATYTGLTPYGLYVHEEQPASTTMVRDKFDEYVDNYYADNQTTTPTYHYHKADLTITVDGNTSYPSLKIYLRAEAKYNV